MATEMNPLDVLRKIKWNDHKKEIIEEQQYLFDNNLECDCVLISAQGKRIQVHQFVLSSSSEFFRKILSELPPHVDLPTIHLPDVDTFILEAIIKFVYTGQTNIGSTHLSTLFKFCEFLNIKGCVANGFTIFTLNGAGTTIGNDVEQTLSTYGSDIRPHKDSNENWCSDEPELDDINHLELEDGTESIEPEYLEEYLDDVAIMDIKEHIFVENDDYDDSKKEADDNGFIAFEIESPADSMEIDGGESSQMMMKRQYRRQGTRSTNFQIDKALNEVHNGKTIHKLSVEYNLPRSTLYHRFRNNENLKQNYRLERKTALDNAVRAVLNERLSLKMAADRYKIPKTAIWREVNKCGQYQPSTKEISVERHNAQLEILSGKSLTSISGKYGTEH